MFKKKIKYPYLIALFTSLKPVFYKMLCKYIRGSDTNLRNFTKCIAVIDIPTL